MLNLPLALIGGVIGVFISGGVLSVASIIGFITLFGLLTSTALNMIVVPALYLRFGCIDCRNSNTASQSVSVENAAAEHSQSEVTAN